MTTYTFRMVVKTLFANFSGNSFFSDIISCTLGSFAATLIFISSLRDNTQFCSGFRFESRYASIDSAVDTAATRTASGRPLNSDTGVASPDDDSAIGAAMANNGITMRVIHPTDISAPPLACLACATTIEIAACGIHRPSHLVPSVRF